MFSAHRDSVVIAHEAIQKPLQSTEIQPVIEANCNIIVHRSLSSILNSCSKLVLNNSKETSASSMQFEGTLFLNKPGLNLLGTGFTFPQSLIFSIQSPRRENEILFGKTNDLFSFENLIAAPMRIWATLSKTLRWIIPKNPLGLLDSIFSDLSLKKTQHGNTWMSNSFAHPTHIRFNNGLFGFFKSSNSFFYALQF
jgi:hypothetical protein